MLAGWDEQIPDPHQRLKRYIEILGKSSHEIQEFGCPMGSLCTELAKLHHAQQYNANEMFEIFRNWLREQFAMLGHQRDADQLAMHLITRAQGIALVVNAYRDADFLQREIAELNRWVEQL